MIYILYSGDYEVYMGGNYLPESDVLIEPAERALEAFEDIGVPVTYFADLLCFWRYRELGFTGFPDAVDAQLKNVWERGHDVQMHIHPQWSIADIARHEDKSSHYTFGHEWLYPGKHMGDVYEVMLEHLTKGKTYLEDLLRDVGEDYRCIAYRAGAYGILPEDKAILAAIEDAGYLIDSSVVPGYPGLAEESPLVDFRDAVKKGNYRVSREGGVKKESATGIYEIPVGACCVNDFLPLMKRKLTSVSNKVTGKKKPHEAIGYTANERAKKLGLIKPVESQSTSQRLKKSIERVTASSFWGMLDIVDDVSEMVALTKNYVNQYKNEEQDLFFSVSFHPKDFTKERRLAFKEYHKRLEDCYGDEIKAITFHEAGKIIENM